MPRIYASNADPIDFCQDCFPAYGTAEEDWGDIGDGPDDRGNCFEYKADHPPYEITGYRCVGCNKPLGVEDN